MASAKRQDLLTKLCCKSAMLLGDVNVSFLKVMVDVSKIKKMHPFSFLRCVRLTPEKNKNRSHWIAANPVHWERKRGEIVCVKCYVF